MVAYVFQQISQKGRAEGIGNPNLERDARTWFRESAQQIRSVNASRMMNDKSNVKSRIVVNDIGKMFMFFYDPKLKEQLPYYDTFPLVFPIGFRDNGFIGINLHYLPLGYRARLMDALYSTSSNTKYNDDTKLKISYDLLNGASRFKYFKPCIKHYLWDHVQGQRYLNIQPSNWDSALMLPTERFKKASKDVIWKESVGKF